MISLICQIQLMYWTPEEEALQQQAEATGAVPPGALQPEDNIAEDGPPVFQWHVPQDMPEPEPMDAPPLWIQQPPVMNGIHEDYEGDLVAVLEAAWVMHEPGAPGGDLPD